MNLIYSFSNRSVLDHDLAQFRCHTRVIRPPTGFLCLRFGLPQGFAVSRKKKMLELVVATECIIDQVSSSGNQLRPGPYHYYPRR